MKANSFPYRLFQLLEHVDKSPDLQAIISWQPHGRSFLIRDKKRLEDEVLPLFFSTAQYDSFRRNLNLWGFVQIRDVNSADFKSYYHQFFLRTREDLCSKLKRQKLGELVSKKDSLCPFFEPRFHEMEWLPSSTKANQEDKIQEYLPYSITPPGANVGNTVKASTTDFVSANVTRSISDTTFATNILETTRSIITLSGDENTSSGSSFASDFPGAFEHPFVAPYSFIPRRDVGNIDRTVNTKASTTDFVSANMPRRIKNDTPPAASNIERTRSIITTSTEEEAKSSCLDHVQEVIQVLPLLDLDCNEVWDACHLDLWQEFLKQQKSLLPNNLYELNSVFD